jgi:hypothetical protein
MIFTSKKSRYKTYVLGKRVFPDPGACNTRAREDFFNIGNPQWDIAIPLSISANPFLPVPGI